MKDNDIMYSDSGIPPLFNKECGRWPTYKEYNIIMDDVKNSRNTNKVLEPGYFDKFLTIYHTSF